MKGIFKNKRLLLSSLALIFIVITFAVLAWTKIKENSSRNQVTDNQLEQEVESDSSGKLTVLVGSLTLAKEGGEVKLNTNEEADVHIGDTIITDENGTAEINYQDKAFIRIAPNSTVVFNPEKTEYPIFNSLGSIYVRITKILGKEESFGVETSTAVAAVRGTSFIVEVTPENETRASVVENKILIFKKDDQTGEVLDDTKQEITQGIYAIVAPKKPIVIKKHVPTQKELEWIKFNQDRDKEVLGFVIAPPPSPLSPTPTSTPTSEPTPTPTAQVGFLSQMPAVGYQTGRVKTSVGEFPLSCYGSNQSSVKVVTDSANENDCHDNCPVLPLHEYATKNNGVAAMNGMYFCPADYASCQGKINTFDTLFFNSRVKRYINSENNIYSTLPFLVVHADGSTRFVPRALEWGRDTSIQAGIAGNPLLIQNRNKVANESTLDEKQKTVKANRGAFVQNGSNLHLCVVGNATVMDTAFVYETLGVDNALNIDGGGSSALWINGSYKYGPGRNIPNALIFARK
jgi:hypothetical protein